MNRFLIALVLLLVASPARAEAPAAVPGDADRYAFTAPDADPGPGVARSVGGSELLLELSHRVKTRFNEENSRGPRRPGEVSPLQAQLILAVQSQRAALAREARLHCAESPFQFYLPVYPIPPPPGQ